MKLFELSGVKKCYKKHLALDIPSLIIERGGCAAVYGPNGSGKTTLLNLLAFLDTATEGNVKIYSEVHKLTPRRGRDVTLVMQEPYLFGMSVFKNVSYGLSARSFGRQRIEERARPVMKRLGLWTMREKNARLLSGGEKKRLAIARGLVVDAETLLLDEPTSNVDRQYASVIETIISEYAAIPGRTVLVATHDLAQAHRLTKRIIYLSNGTVSVSSVRERELERSESQVLSLRANEASEAIPLFSNSD
ncbi:MAG: ABC transporter ATP-binding protein [Candidatus Omnitrophota bacterium]